ncbi:hypothetical protein Pla163_28440 [Planctomycetes bacterium Pla163]|uniref:Uncharacterized protein n=1 Tax=Rohdeia mirabilis TaxID=2528008 RepID=A0A518D2L0_9BACT|nr:hypothetical protein Pla163_28440 [Planctomycetes bacterium Pla163]
MSDVRQQRAARPRTVTGGRVLFALALLAAGAHVAGDLSAPLRAIATVVGALTVLTWCLGPVTVLLARRVGERVAAPDAPPAQSAPAALALSEAPTASSAVAAPVAPNAPGAAVAPDAPQSSGEVAALDPGRIGPRVCAANVATAVVLGPPLFVVVVVILRASGLELHHALASAFVLCGAGHLALGHGARAVGPLGAGRARDAAGSVPNGSPRSESERSDATRADAARSDSRRTAAARSGAVELDDAQLDDAHREAFAHEAAPRGDGQQGDPPLDAVPLESAELENAPLGDAAPRAVRLEVAGLDDAPLESGRIESAELENAPLGDAAPRAVRLEVAGLDDAPLESGRIESAELGNAPLGDAAPRAVRLEVAGLDDAPLESGRIESAELENAPFGDAPLGAANLEAVDLESAQPETPREERPSARSSAASIDGRWAPWTAFAVALVLAGLAAAPWLGAGPSSTGALDPDLAERFLLAAASTTELAFDDPQLANAAPLASRARAHLDGVLGAALHLGPFAAAGFQTLWSVLALGLAGASFVARRRPRARAALATAPLVAVFGAVAAGAVASQVADPFLRAASDHTFAAVLALVVTGLVAWRESAAGDPVQRGWLGLSAVTFATAFVLDPWIGAVALATAAVASARGPHAVDRLLALVLAAIPALALPLVGWPEPTTAPGGFVAIGPILVLAVAATALVRAPQRSAAERAASHAPSAGDDLRLAAATLAIGSLAASWAGGGAALAALLASGSVAALTIVGAWPRAQWILVALCAVAAFGPARDALAAARATTVLEDAGPVRLGVRLDAPDVVRAAWEGEPGPDVYDPHWREPLDSQTQDAADWAALWTTLQRDVALRALDPVLLVDPRAPGPRYAGGAEVSAARGVPHEGALLANLDLFVVSNTELRDLPSDVPTAAQRLETVAELLGDDGVIAGVHRRRLEALARPFVVPVGPQQRERVRGLDLRLVQFGCVELVRHGAVSLYGWPAASFDALASD